MKRLLIILSAVATLTLTACGNNNDEVVTTTTTAAITTEQEEATTTTPAPVEDITTTTVTDEVTTSEITTIPEEVTTEATTTTEAAPIWVDEALPEATMYATTACYVRKDAVVGSDALYVVAAGKAVTIIGKTDTGYFKLSDGGYIHSDYLSTQKPVEEVVTTTAPVQTEEPTTTTEALAPAYDLPEYNLTGATYKGIEIVITEEDIEAINSGVFAKVNELRSTVGVSLLSRTPSFNMVARIRANDLTESFGHDRPDGSSCDTVCQSLDVCYSMGENIAARPLSTSVNSIYLAGDGKYHIDVNYMIDYVMNGLKNSAGHYDNMINPSYKQIAIDVDFGLSNENANSHKLTNGFFYLYLVQNFKY